ncbi:TlpA family protein disulfide reductase [Nocardioides sp.]|uniref:TlpA family protein disulfide reductase n=1 Tax=Nocardioides sp. TaxID=35761 RepID=UPI0035B24D46
MRRALAALLLAGTLSACAPGGGNPIDVRPPDVDVDTPALREVKARIGMEDCAPGDGEPVEGGLPEVTLPCLGGGPDVELSALRGPMVINLWQAGCVPCREEMPALESFHQQHADRVRVLGIDFNDVHPGRALELAEDTGATYPSIADPGGELMTERAFALARRGIPVFLFLDADGLVAGQAAGGVDSAAEVEDLVAEHLGITL